MFPSACIFLRCVNGRRPGEEAGPDGAGREGGGSEQPTLHQGKALRRRNWAACWWLGEVKEHA